MLAPERVLVPLRSADKTGVLTELMELVIRSCGLEGRREAVQQAVWERERVLSTGIGEGVAIPHAKLDAVSEIVMAAGVSPRPLDYGALDGRPVQLFFLILGPEAAAGAQVRVLSRIGRLLRDERLRGRLVSAGDAEGFLRVLEVAEAAG